MEHAWDVSVSEATAIQKRMRHALRIEPLLRAPITIAGADISYNRGSDDFFACVVVLSLPDLIEVEVALGTGVATFPYVPGYLSFREIPTLLETFKRLKSMPDIVMCDGQGIAHPRRMGIAAHLGQIIDIPSFGCAKSVLYGEAEMPAMGRGSISYVRDSRAEGEVIGALVRTKDSVAPVVVSAGHRITLDESIRLVIETTRGYRVPEPTRRAHDIVNRFRRGEIGA